MYNPFPFSLSFLLSLTLFLSLPHPFPLLFSVLFSFDFFPLLFFLKCCFAVTYFGGIIGGVLHTL